MSWLIIEILILNLTTNKLTYDLQYMLLCFILKSLLRIPN